MNLVPTKTLAANHGSLDLNEVDQVMLTVILDLAARLAELERKCYQLTASMEGRSTNGE